MKRARSLARWLVATAAASLYACAGLTAVNDFTTEPSSDGGGSLSVGRCGRFGYESASCVKCLDEKCCSEQKLCRDSAICAPLVDCLAGCAPENGACRHACFTEQHNSDAAAAALFSCGLGNCNEP